MSQNNTYMGHLLRIAIGIMILATLLLANGAAAEDSYEFVLGIPSQQWRFDYPGGIEVDSSGNVYVADDIHHSIQKFSSSGSFLEKWGSYGSGDSQFKFAEGIAVDDSGNVYVADLQNHRIQKFSSSGSFLAKWGSYGIGDGQFRYPWGIAVDSSGNVYVVDQHNNRIQKFSSSGDFLTKWGSNGSGDGQFYLPKEIAVDNNGNVYVTETGNHRIQKFSSSGGFLAKWGSQGSGDGQFEYPWGIAVDSSGNVYVAENNNNRIQKFSSSGNFLAKWGSYGGGDGQFIFPYGIAVDSSGNVYVIERGGSGSHRIQKFSSSGSFLAKWGDPVSGDGQFNSPYGIAVDGSGNVYVTDSDMFIDSTNNRIQKFSSSGGFLAKWGSLGSGDGQFNSPNGIAVDGSGNVYVADLHRIQKFSSSGDFLAKWGSQGSGDGQFIYAPGIAIDSSGNVYVADMQNHRIQKFSSSGGFLAKWGSKGSGDGQFIFPRGIAVDSSGNVYVANDNRIQKFSSSGDFLIKWGSNGSGDGQFNSPNGIAVDSSGNVYVTDFYNNRIQKFSSSGSFLAKWGSYGGVDGQFYGPQGIAVDNSGNVYVTETGNRRIQKFRTLAADEPPIPITIKESILFVDNYPILDNESKYLNLTTSHQIWTKANIQNVGITQSSTITGTINLQILDNKGNNLWSNEKDGTIYLTVDPSDINDLTISIVPDSLYQIPDIPELYGERIIRFTVIPSSDKIGKIEISRPIYISPYDIDSYEKDGTYFYSFSYSKENDDLGPVVIIASPEYEQYAAYQSSYGEDKTYDITIPTFIAHQELVGLTELAKKYPYSKVVILSKKDKEEKIIDKIKWNIEHFKNKGKIPLIVGAVPHDHVTYNELKISKAYSASYMSYAMASSVNDLILWDGIDKKVFVTNNFRSDEMSKPLIPKYSKDSTQFANIKEYPSIVFGRTNLPFLQIAPTLSTKDIRENGGFNKNYSTYRIGPLVPIGHTYYIGASASIPAISISLNPTGLSLNFGYGITLPIINKEIGLSFSLIGGKSGIYGDLLFIAFHITDGLNNLLNEERTVGTCPILCVTFKIADYLPFSNELIELDNAIKVLFTAISTGYQQYFIVGLSLENYLEPSNIFTILKTTADDIGSSPDPVYFSVENIRESYTSSIVDENAFMSGVAALSSLTKLAQIFGIGIGISMTGSPEILYYTGITDDVNMVMLTDDLNTIGDKPFTYKEYPEGTLDTSFQQKLILFNNMHDIPVKTYVKQKLSGLTNLNEGIFKDTRLYINTQIKEYTDSHITLGRIKSDIINRMANAIAEGYGFKFSINYDIFSIINALGIFTKTYSEAMEVADVSTQELYFFGAPTATGYDDPLYSKSPDALPTEFNIILKNEPLTLDVFNSTFIFANITDVVSLNMSMKIITTSYDPSTGYPQVPMITLGIKSPATQTIQYINVTLQNSRFFENISLPTTVIQIGEEPKPGIITNTTQWPLQEWSWEAKTIRNVTYNIINIFPFQYDLENNNGRYYESINISIKTKTFEPVFKTVKIEAYPNIISIGPDFEINESLRIFNDYIAKDNSSNIQVIAEIPDNIEIINTDGTIDNNNGKKISWHIPELNNDPSNYSKFLYLTIKSPSNIQNLTPTAINTTISYMTGDKTEKNNLSIPILLVPENLVDLEITRLDIPSVLYTNNSYNISARILNKGSSEIAMVPIRLYLNKELVEFETVDRIKPYEKRTIYFNFTPKEQGIFNMTSSVVGLPLEVNINNNIFTKNVTVVVGVHDDIPPSTDISLSGTDGDNDWYVSNVLVSLTASDTGTGLANIMYSVDNGSWIEYVEPFIIDKEGTTTIHYRSMDYVGNLEEIKTMPVKIDKTLPIITIDRPMPYGLYVTGTALNFSATDSISGILTVTGNLTNTTKFSKEIDTNFMPEPGVYTLTVKAIDNAGNVATSDSIFFILYDPSGGFATGGGWFYPDSESTLPGGKAEFGFVAKYMNGASTGNLEFQYKAANINLKSSTIDWLVISGTSAQFQGTGTINGTGLYTFRITAKDNGEPGTNDHFDIRIWDGTNTDKNLFHKSKNTLSGGNIVVHKN